MEYVSAILYHKIQDSDFTNMYGIKKPTSGGGQTYIQAAGYDHWELDKMFAEADTITDTIEFWDPEKKYPRKKYNFLAYSIDARSRAELELAPRTGRKDYRISRQGLNHRHPAWSAYAGFPIPRKKTSDSADSTTIYEYEKNYPGIIDNLFIYILKTVSDANETKYYASFVNSADMPESWPKGLGLEQIFKKQSHQGILFYDQQFIRFTNNHQCPFETGCAADSDIGDVELPLDLALSPEDAVEYAKKPLEIDIDIDSITFEEIDVPSIKRKPKSSASSYIRKDNDYIRREKNKKKIGDIGETLALAIEIDRLTKLGHSNLIDQIKHVSKTDGDGLGYDILSYDMIDGKIQERFIEVKATTGNATKPFDISINEVETSEKHGTQYYIYRLFNIHNKMSTASYYIINGSVKSNFMLEPTSFKAYPNPSE